MGKTYKKNYKSIRKKNLYSNMYYFNVLVRVHGKNPHTELYSIRKKELSYAEKLGYLKEGDTYLDWKPLRDVKTFKGGIHKVKRYSFDEKYVYAYTDNSSIPNFSLPKYLYNKLPNKDYILVARREKIN